MRRVYFVILLGFFSCTQDPPIQLSDLRFPDPERDFIKQNRIDTTFIFVRQESGSDLRFYKVYDENGNIIADSNYLVCVRYRYDRTGLLIQQETLRERSNWIDSISYEFDTNSMVLKQRWMNSNIEYKFFFDEKGIVQRQVKWDLAGGGRKDSISYMYRGELLQKLIIYVNNKDSPYVENYFYYSSKGILDSVTLKETDTGYRQRWVYDSLGLVNAEWMGGHKSEDRFVHKRRR